MKIGRDVSDIQYHGFMDCLVNVLPADGHAEHGVINTVVDGGHGPGDTNTYETKLNIFY